MTESSKVRRVLAVNPLQLSITHFILNIYYMFSCLLLCLGVVTYWCVSTLLKCFSEAEPKWTLCSGKPLQEQSSDPQAHLKCQLKISTLLQQTSFLSYFRGDRIKSVSWEISWRFISRIAGVYCFPLIDSLIQKVGKKNC